MERRIMKHISNEHFKLLLNIKNRLTPVYEEWGNPCENFCKGCASCDAWKESIQLLTGLPNTLTWGEEEIWDDEEQVV
jgi:hypothetical protein